MTRSSTITVTAPLAAVVMDVTVAPNEAVSAGDQLALLESMKMQTPVLAPANGRVIDWHISVGQTIQKGVTLCAFETVDEVVDISENNSVNAGTESSALEELRRRLALTGDALRHEQAAKRHQKGYRTARENLEDLCDAGSFIEYGQLAVAAQRQRRDIDDLRRSTAADGIITGLAAINGEWLGADAARAVVIINDYSVLAGTQGYFHHKKLDRALAQAAELHLPVVMYTEGGGGRPGDTDVLTQIAGLNLSTFYRWAGLRGVVPRIAVNNGYCFAGNAALFGAADITIATRTSWIGMAGPSMIEGGGLGSYAPTEIGPIEVQSRNGVVDIVAADEADATRLARQALGYFQGRCGEWQCADQSDIAATLPADRRYVYDSGKVIQQLFDTGSVLELKAAFGRALITCLARLEGRPVGLIASNCQHLGGAVDAEASDKAAEFIELCAAFDIPIISLIDTPGFMVGPASEEQAAVRRMSRLFACGAQADVPWVAIFLRRAYGLGAMALAGGSFERPVYAAAWPSGEFGAMGLEGAVRLGFKKELEAVASEEEREALFQTLLADQYQRGKATEAASFLEIDAVIDPADTRRVIAGALQSAGY